MLAWADLLGWDGLIHPIGVQGPATAHGALVEVLAIVSNVVLYAVHVWSVSPDRIIKALAATVWAAGDTVGADGHQ